jgi:glycosyltransferase involved in cell wall biosynthesis
MVSLSVVVPVYHNQETLRELHSRLVAMCSGIVPDAYELIFVNDGSTDRSWEVLSHIAATDIRVRAIALSRNFGSQAAILSGLAQATGDRIAVIAADLQEPPELLSDLYTACDAGAEIALASRSTRGDPWVTRQFARIFYALLRRFALPEMPMGGFDCFVASRRVGQLLLSHARPNVYLPGELLWLGFSRTVIPYDRLARPAGRSMWTFWKKFRFLIDSFVAFSYTPIRLTSTLGLLFAIAGFLYAIIILALRITSGFPVEGWASLAVIVLIIGGVQLIVLGTLGEYVWRTLDTGRNRPLYVVETIINPLPPVAPPIGSTGKVGPSPLPVPSSRQ